MPKLHFSWRKAMISALLFAGLGFLLSGCDMFKSDQDTSLDDSINFSTPTIVLKVAYENKENEPIDIGFKRWKRELENRSFGTMTLELYPDSKLGSKDQILNRISAGENLITIADGAFFYGLNQKEMGIVFGPYLASNWNEAFNISRSVWYQKQSINLARRTGIKTISVDWGYGVRHLLTKKPINTLDDLKGLKIRVPSNIIQEKTFEVFGAIPVKMPLSDVNAALNSGQVDGLENPITTLYHGGFHKYAPYLTLTGHVYNVTNIVMSQKQWMAMNASQQRMLVDSCNRAAKFYNVVQAADELAVLKKMKEEGVKVTVPSQILMQNLREASLKFYSLPEFSKDWPETLYTNLQRVKNNQAQKNIDLMTHSDVLNVSYARPESLDGVKTTNTAPVSTPLINEHYSTNNEHSSISGEVYFIPAADENDAAIVLEENPPKDLTPIWNPAKQGAKYKQPEVPIVAPLGDFAKQAAPQPRRRQNEAAQPRNQSAAPTPRNNQTQPAQTQQAQNQPAQTPRPTPEQQSRPAQAEQPVVRVQPAPQVEAENPRPTQMLRNLQ